jgi:hypothetical protein
VLSSRRRNLQSGVFHAQSHNTPKPARFDTEKAKGWKEVHSLESLAISKQSPWFDRGRLILLGLISCSVDE